VTILQRLARKAIRYGVRPEEIGPHSAFKDEAYLSLYLTRTMRRWRAPAAYGVQPKQQERARRAWDKLIARLAACDDERQI
jgi:hypothetical protein